MQKAARRTVALPLLEDVQQREMVTLGNEELFPRRVAFDLAILGPAPLTHHRVSMAQRRSDAETAAQPQPLATRIQSRGSGSHHTHT
jgi:hypothetical protein